MGQDDSSDTDVSPTLLAFLRPTGKVHAETLTYLHLLDRCVDITDLPGHERLANAEALADRSENLSPMHFLVCKLNAIPAFSKAHELDLNFIVELHIARVALAIERYRLVEGRLPESLEELTGDYLDEIPTDAFDGGKPLKYKPMDSEYVVYGVGRDRIDNGGTEINAKGYKDDEGTDITFMMTK